MSDIRECVCVYVYARICFSSFGDLVKDTCDKRKRGCTVQAFQSRLPHMVALVLTGTAFELQAEKAHSPPHGAKDLGEGVQDTCRKLKTVLLYVIFSRGNYPPCWM